MQQNPGRGGRRANAGRKPGSLRGRRPRLEQTVSPEAYALWEAQPKGWLDALILAARPQESQSLTIYGDESNRTLCARGCVDATQWATIFDDEEGRDVVVVSDGTILEFTEVDGFFRIDALVTGSALEFIDTGTGRSDEAFFEGQIAWVLFGAKIDLVLVNSEFQSE